MYCPPAHKSVLCFCIKFKPSLSGPSPFLAESTGSRKRQWPCYVSCWAFLTSCDRNYTPGLFFIFQNLWLFLCNYGRFFLCPGPSPASVPLAAVGSTYNMTNEGHVHLHLWKFDKILCYWAESIVKPCAHQSTISVYDENDVSTFTFYWHSFVLTSLAYPLQSWSTSCVYSMTYSTSLWIYDSMMYHAVPGLMLKDVVIMSTADPGFTSSQRVVRPRRCLPSLRHDLCLTWAIMMLPRLAELSLWPCSLTVSCFAAQVGVVMSASLCPSLNVACDWWWTAELKCIWQIRLHYSARFW